MTLANNGELKSELSSYNFHQRFIARYDTFIALFETAANARLRVLPMEASALLTTSGGSCPLPSDYLAWRTVKPVPVAPGTRAPYDELEYVHPAYLPPVFAPRGRPPLFTIEGNTFSTRPIDDAPDKWEFHYYRKIPTLLGGTSPAANTNWLLTEFPGAYLFGLMAESFAHGRNMEGAQLYKARRDEAFQEVISRYAPTTGATSPQVRTAEYF
jgi:hypothetical protein